MEEPPVLGVELDFEFDKSDELYRAIEDTYQEVHDVLDIWQAEFSNDPRVADRMYFSEYLAKRLEMCHDMKFSPDEEVSACTHPFSRAPLLLIFLSPTLT